MKDKVSARIGLTNIASNVATAASPEPTQPPLAAVLPPRPSEFNASLDAAHAALQAAEPDPPKVSPTRKGKA